MSNLLGSGQRAGNGQEWLEEENESGLFKGIGSKLHSLKGKPAD
ncbi:hypothetical protein PO124_21485 [Bacillus licheniformis]|nr:hypothetical protein [Bacillus licheniformis]